MDTKIEVKEVSESVHKVGESVQKGVASFLSGRPLWAFWILYTILSGALFGVFYIAMYFIVLQWWIPVIIIIGVGMLWGSIAHSKANKSKRKKHS
jgi:L-asparagine transporter-like permease